MDRKRNDKGEIMKVLSIKEPFATLIKEGKKKNRNEKLENILSWRIIYTRK